MNKPLVKCEGCKRLTSVKLRDGLVTHANKCLHTGQIMENGYAMQCHSARCGGPYRS